ncbi:hypothetical protein BDZ89DRAFT_1044244 [Hymenopellis radicata]|nr:hypothetical protein BDZ89DRAFT_1044244 [Hymenopellis radicata]
MLPRPAASPLHEKVVTHGHKVHTPDELIPHIQDELHAARQKIQDNKAAKKHTDAKAKAAQKKKSVFRIAGVEDQLQKEDTERQEMSIVDIIALSKSIVPKQGPVKKVERSASQAEQDDEKKQDDTMTNVSIHASQSCTERQRLIRRRRNTRHAWWELVVPASMNNTLNFDQLGLSDEEGEKSARLEDDEILDAGNFLDVPPGTDSEGFLSGDRRWDEDEDEDEGDSRRLTHGKKAFYGDFQDDTLDMSNDDDDYKPASRGNALPGLESTDVRMQVDAEERMADSDEEAVELERRIAEMQQAVATLRHKKAGKGKSKLQPVPKVEEFKK